MKGYDGLRKPISDIVLESMSEQDSLLFRGIMVPLEKDEVLARFDSLWKDANQIADDHVLDIKGQIDFVLERLSPWHQDCLDHETNFFKGWSVEELETAEVKLIDVVALYIYENRNKADRTRLEISKKLNALIVTPRMRTRKTFLADNIRSLRPEYRLEHLSGKKLSKIPFFGFLNTMFLLHGYSKDELQEAWFDLPCLIAEQPDTSDWRNIGLAQALYLFFAPLEKREIIPYWYAFTYFL